MPFTVEEFHDLIRLLEERPEWRTELRRFVLTDQLLALPEQLAELRVYTEQRFQELAAAQRRTEERVTELAAAQRRTEEQVAAGKLDDYKILVMFDVKLLPQSVAEKIVSFVNKGGVVVPALFIPERAVRCGPGTIVRQVLRLDGFRALASRAPE